MASFNNDNQRTFKTTEAIDANLRVTPDANGEIAKSGAGDLNTIGVTAQDAKSGDVVAVRLRSTSGTCKGVAAGAIAAGARVEGATTGRFQTLAAGAAVGVALNAAAAAGDVFEFVWL